jgi:uncharacterized protein YqjF (DUF2071 family)
MDQIAARIAQLAGAAPQSLDATSREWLMFESWDDLLLASWPVPATAVRSLVPPGLEIDTFDGSAWVSIVPFRAGNMRLRWLPQIPGQADFHELNFRTYVRLDETRAVYFLSLDCPGALASLVGSKLFGLPFKDATMRIERRDDGYRVESRRTMRGEPPAEFVASYLPHGEAVTPRPGSLEDFLTARLSLFVVGRTGQLHRGDIWHGPWLLQPVDVQIESNTIARAVGITLPDAPPHAAFAAHTDSLVYPPVRVATT